VSAGGRPGPAPVTQGAGGLVELQGACHCGAIRVLYRTRFPVDELRIGRCGCGFCRRHGARTSSDPGGQVEVVEGPPGAARYRFGLRTADFLICRGCGVYVAAVLEADGGLLSTLNVNLLDARDVFDPAPPLYHYDRETAEERRARRKARWTPTVLRGA
jgi:hypothetical protein